MTEAEAKPTMPQEQGNQVDSAGSGSLRTARLVLLRIIDHPLDLKARIAEIEEQAEPEPGFFEIVDALRSVNRIQRRDRFQFNQNGVLHQQVGRIYTDHDTIIVDRDIVLLLDRPAGFTQLDRQGVFIDLFEESNASVFETINPHPMIFSET